MTEYTQNVTSISFNFAEIPYVNISFRKKRMILGTSLIPHSNYIPVKEKFFTFQWLTRECLCMRLVFLVSALGMIPVL